jgi:hypothetical protein
LILVKLFNLIFKDGFKKMLELVNKELEIRKKASSSTTKKEDKVNVVEQADGLNSAYQELYELTQRKFLQQISKYCQKMSESKEYPRLFCVDLMAAVQLPPNSEVNKEMIPCVRVMCEHEEGWHLSESFVALFSETNPLLKELASSPYLARMMTIIKNGPLCNEMQIFLSEQGQSLLREIEKKAAQQSVTDGADESVAESYISLRKSFIKMCEEEKKPPQAAVGSLEALQRCELKNGKILWLCKSHVESTKAPILTDISFHNQNAVSLYEKFLDYVDKASVD